MRALILGCSRIGVGLAQRLAVGGHDVTVVEPAAAALAHLPPGFSGRTLRGEVLDRRVLLEAQIDRQDALAAVTSSDDVNVVAARLARLIFRVPRVVARVYRPRAAEVYQRLGIQTICTTTWGINRIAELLSYAEYEPLVSLGSDVDILDVAVPPLLVGRTAGAIARPGEVQVAAISRGGRTFLPQLETRLEAGDLLHLVVLSAATEQLIARLRS